MDLEPGMVKWLHLAGGYGHLRYWPIQWQPTPVDRAVRVDVEKVSAGAPALPATVRSTATRARRKPAASRV